MEKDSNVTNVYGILFKDCNFDNTTIMQQNNIVEPAHPADESQEEAVEEEQTLEPMFFNPRIFNSNDRLQQLRKTIGQYLEMGDANDEFGEPTDYRLDLKNNNEWYYLMKAIEEANIAGSFHVPELVDMVLKWFPKLHLLDENEQIEQFKGRISKSVSKEKNKWKYQNGVTQLKDMLARREALQLNYDDVFRMFQASYKGLYTALIALKKNLQK